MCIRDRCISVEEVRERLNGIVDYIFWHERKIINRLDDSVIQINRKKLVTYRRARGFAPSPIKLPPGFDNEQYGIGLGAELDVAGLDAIAQMEEARSNLLGGLYSSIIGSQGGSNEGGLFSNFLGDLDLQDIIDALTGG